MRATAMSPMWRNAPISRHSAQCDCSSIRGAGTECRGICALENTCWRIMVELKPPPQKLFADAVQPYGRSNYIRFRLSPDSSVALAARVKLAGQDFVGEQRELFLSENQPGEETPYERLLGDAMAGDGALFTREDAVEAAWAVVDPVLKHHQRVHFYRRGSWAPKEEDAIIAADGGWQNPGRTASSE